MRPATLGALTWTDPGHAREVLLRQPSTCLRPGDQRTEIDLGRALFNAPQLLGGQAARAGISCASCHANGRRSAQFFLGGVSDAPGTADVSASFFSLARANGRFDPKPIPDLAVPGKVSREPRSGALERFIRGLIVDEFSGHEPGAAALAALAAYVRAVGPCADSRDTARTVGDQIGLVRAGVAGGAAMAGAGDSTTAALLIGGVRHQLGLIDERMAGPRLAGEREALLRASRELQPIGQSAQVDPALLAAWLARFDRDIAPRLVRAMPRSLYNPQRLDRWLAARIR